MEVTCPFCHKSFEPNDVLFYADPTEQKFITIMNEMTGEAVNATTTGGDNVYLPVTDVDGMGTQRRSSMRHNSAQLNHAQNVPGTTSEEEGNMPQLSMPLGELVEDSKFKEFLGAFGEGVAFRCKRTARFYAVKNKGDIRPDENGYGYVDEEFQAKNQVIPSVLFVPSRENGKQRISNPICPHCHCDLPTQYFNIPEQNRHIAALSGCSAAGKTQYITVALQDLLSKFSQMDLGQTIKLEKCSEWFNEMYMAQFSGKEGINPTKKDFKLFPMLLEILTQNGDYHSITVHDCAGEYAKDDNYAINLDGFQNADTLLLMVDAAQMFGLKLADDERKSVGDYILALSPMQRFPAMIRSLKQVIVVLTKCDTIIGKDKKIQKLAPNSSIEMISYTSDLTCHTNGFDVQTVRMNNSQLQGVLAKSGMMNFQKNILTSLNINRKGNELQSVTLFAVSTYSRNIGKDTFEKVTDVRGARFHRLIEPLLYAMYEWGMLNENTSEDEPLGPSHKGWLFFKRK